MNTTEGMVVTVKSSERGREYGGDPVILKKKGIKFSDLPEDVYSVLIDLVAALDENLAEHDAHQNNEQTNYGSGRRFFFAHPNLLTLSLVGCRALVPLCRRHIFRVVEVWSPNSNSNGDWYFDKSFQHRRLEDLLNVSPHLAYYIRDVLWLLGKNSEDKPAASLFQLPRLRSMTLKGRMHDPTDMSMMPNTVSVLQHFITLPGFTSIHLIDIQNVCILPLIKACPTLQDVGLERVSSLHHCPAWTAFCGDPNAVSNMPSVRSLSISRPIDTTFCLKTFEDILIASPRLTSAHLYWIHYSGKNEGFHFPTIKSWNPSIHHRQVESEVTTLMSRCGETLRHLKLDMFYHSRNLILNDLGRILSSLTSFPNVIETLDISLPYPGNECIESVLPDVPISSWSSLDNVLSSFPSLKRLSIKIMFYVWSEYKIQTGFGGLIRQCLRRYEENLRTLRSSTRIRFSFTISMDTEDTELRYRNLNITEVTGPSK
ncbi:hypothetical protein BJ165DRAFT_1528098 [Panaeolus papilionaceus]|nr:hypothetical protein BJ165DRAFT_1528098 [Panaeolus papilionaceus]